MTGDRTLLARARAGARRRGLRGQAIRDGRPDLDADAYITPREAPVSIRVLAVDDEPDILRLVEVKLKKAGFEVLTARDGEEGLNPPSPSVRTSS